MAARWGFHSPPAFSRAFLAAYGTPPGEWRHRFLGPASPRKPVSRRRARTRR
ncbi:hypothetical protein [Streptomyces sp. NPDC127108]|uniref:hypothetical protein n=1 Tax=Streptomyces sp. NPDC127108 TaxID=3345361 RepID=UPI00362D83C7